MARTKEFDTDEVLSKAINLFWDKGYNGCSMQDVVDGLGLSRSSIYETFGDKRQLFLEALKKYQYEGLKALEEDINTTSDIRQSLTKVFESVIPQSQDSPLQKGCFMVNSAVELACQDPEIAEIVRVNRLEVEDILCKAIEKGQQSGVSGAARRTRSTSEGTRRQERRVVRSKEAFRGDGPEDA